MPMHCPRSRKFVPNMVTARLSKDSIKPGDRVHIQTFWRNDGLEPAAEDYQMRTQLWVDDEHRFGGAGAAEETRWNPLIPTSLWKPGGVYEVCSGAIEIPMPPVAHAPGRWAMAIGLWPEKPRLSGTAGEGSVYIDPVSSVIEPFTLTVDPATSEPDEPIYHNRGLWDEIATRKIEVARGEPEAVLETNALRVEVGGNLEWLAITEKATSRTWKSRPNVSVFQVRMLRKDGSPFSFTAAQADIAITSIANRVVFSVDNRDENVSFSGFIEADGDQVRFGIEDVVVSGLSCVDGVAFPNSFPYYEGAGDDYLVLPYGMGIMRPFDYGEPLITEDFFYSLWRRDHRDKDYSLPRLRAMFMPIFGQGGDAGGFGTIVATPVDCRLKVYHRVGAGLEHSVYPVWRYHQDPYDPHYMVDIEIRDDARYHYPRSATYRFAGECSYVDIAKFYQNKRISEGRWPSFAEKVKDRPEVERMAGAATTRLSGVWPVTHSSRTKKVYNTFSQMEETIRGYKAKGAERLMIHVSGWTTGGYDSQFPTKLPPADELGGAKALRSLARTADKLGYLCQLHDNYIDAYMNSPEWNTGLPAKKSNGELMKGGIWAGGQTYQQCPKIQLKHAMRDLPRMAGIMGRVGHGIDVLGCMNIYECYDKEHPCTKQEDIECRRRMATEAQRLFGPVCVEAGHDFLADVIDYGCDIYVTTGVEFRNPAVGVAIPLYALVYHGSLTYISSRRSGDYLFPVLVDGILPGWNMDDEKFWGIYRRTLGLKKRLLYEKMINHRYITENVQETTFESGTRIIVNFGAEAACVDDIQVPASDFVVVEQ